METDCIEGLREQAESLVALSLSHLTPATQERLANDAAIAHQVVAAKTELEKLREQVQNLE